MNDILWGFPPLSVLFLFVIVWAGCVEHRSLKRQQVQGPLYWRILLFGLWFVAVTGFALLWWVTSTGRHGALRFNSISGVFLILVLVHNRVLKPVYKKYRQRALDHITYRVWVR